MPFFAFLSLHFVPFSYHGYDFITQIAFGKRFDAATINWAFDNSTHLNKLYKTTPWVVIVLFVGIGTWVAFQFAYGTYLMIKRSRNAGGGTRQKRFFWQIFAIILLLFFLYGNFGAYPLGNKSFSKIHSKEGRNLAINPLHSFLVGAP